jgi:hypothetical protein
MRIVIISISAKLFKVQKGSRMLIHLVELIRHKNYNGCQHQDKKAHEDDTFHLVSFFDAVDHFYVDEVVTFDEVACAESHDKVEGYLDERTVEVAQEGDES